MIRQQSQMAQCFAVRSLLIGQQMFFASCFIFYHALRICEPSFLLLPLFIERILQIQPSKKKGISCASSRWNFGTARR
ncbi:hypothetical protein QUB17_31720, partial [Microcoleus sp. B5-C4]|uniref:hypothetical protein n=1 Tax=unclassified Microcoleus TaxID=2642155 RepID=UPI002FD00237